MIVVGCIVLGILLRAASGRSLSDLSKVKLRGEPVLLGLLLIQVALPLLRLTGTTARLAFWVWIATFPLLVWSAWANRQYAGMRALAVGLTLNFVVIALNGGMPVFPEAVAAVSSAARSGAIPVGDFVHVVGSAATRLPWLADAIPLPGPSWVRQVPSSGDLLLYVGVVAFIAGARAGADSSRSRPE